MKGVLRVVLLVGVVYVGMNVFMYVNQRGYMYIPSVEYVEPREVGLANVNEVRLQNAAGAELISWFSSPSEGRPSVLFFHGNAGAVYHRAYRIRDFQSAGYGIFILGYPGYGGSGGDPTEASMIEGARLAYDHLVSTGIDPEDIVIWGESIGTGVATQLAAKVDAKALILEAPMSSASDVAAVHYPVMVARYLMKDTFASVDHIDKINMPLLVMHGDRDRVIPVELGIKLAEHAAEPKRLEVLEGAGHNDLSQFPTSEIAREFIEAL